jgi:hypothetical protein
MKLFIPGGLPDSFKGISKSFLKVFLEGKEDWGSVKELGGTPRSCFEVL